MTYKDGKVYKILSKQTDKIYIGSTKETLEERLKKHVLYIKENRYVSSCEIIKYDDYEIVLIELFPCCSKRALNRREGEIQIENKNIIVNKHIAGRTMKEYYIDHKDKFAQYRTDNKDKNAQYYIDNKDKLTLPFECECGLMIQHRNKSRHLKSKKHEKYILTRCQACPMAQQPLLSSHA